MQKLENRIQPKDPEVAFTSATTRKPHLCVFQMWVAVLTHCCETRSLATKGKCLSGWPSDTQKPGEQPYSSARRSHLQVQKDREGYYQRKHWKINQDLIACDRYLCPERFSGSRVLGCMHTLSNSHIHTVFSNPMKSYPSLDRQR